MQPMQGTFLVLDCAIPFRHDHEVLETRTPSLKIDELYDKKITPADPGAINQNRLLRGKYLEN